MISLDLHVVDMSPGTGHLCSPPDSPNNLVWFSNAGGGIIWLHGSRDQLATFGQQILDACDAGNVETEPKAPAVAETVEAAADIHEAVANDPDDTEYPF